MKKTEKKPVFDNDAIELQIEEVLELLRPQFFMHGGDIELRHYEDGNVYVKLEGNCDGCPASNYTLKLLVESTLKKEVPQVKKVIEVE